MVVVTRLGRRPQAVPTHVIGELISPNQGFAPASVQATRDKRRQ